MTSIARLERINRSLPGARAEIQHEGSITPANALVADPFLTTPFAHDEDPRGTEEVLYLPPPTLSRLPFSATLEPKKPFSFERPSVGYTDAVLPSIDLSSWHLHLALEEFRPVSRDYSTLSYTNAFNWRDVKLPVDLEREWYAVAFRSKRAFDEDGTGSQELYEADRAAHEEAVTAGGLLMYWCVISLASRIASRHPIGTGYQQILARISLLAYGSLVQRLFKPCTVPSIKWPCD